MKMAELLAAFENIPEPPKIISLAEWLGREPTETDILLYKRIAITDEDGADDEGLLDG